MNAEGGQEHPRDRPPDSRRDTAWTLSSLLGGFGVTPRDGQGLPLALHSGYGMWGVEPWSAVHKANAHPAVLPELWVMILAE